MSFNRICAIFLWFAVGTICPSAGLAAGAQGGATDAGLVTQKMALLDKLLKRTKSSESYSAAGNQEARDLVAEAEELAGIARENLKKGNLEVATQGLDEAFNRVFSAARMCRKIGRASCRERV